MLIDDRQAPPEPRDAVAEIQQRTKDFTRFYERHAYLVYNLALRVTCEETRARAAAQRAFVERALVDESEDALVAAVVAAALADAPRTPTVSAGASPESVRLLAASAVLQPAERAALALAGLWDADAAVIGPKLRIGAGEAAALVDSAWAGLAERLRMDIASAKAAYADWPWANPPQEIWEKVFRGFARALESSVTRADGAPAPTSKPTRRRLGRRGAVVAIAVLVPVVAAGALAGASRLSGGETEQEPTTVTPVSPSDPGYGALAEGGGATGSPGTAPGAGGAGPGRRKPLTPAEIDKLRMKELQDLKLYEKRERDERLTEDQRAYARKRVGALRDLAQRRLAAERRERELDRRERDLARREARSSRTPRPTRQRETRQTREQRPPAKPDRKKDDDDDARTRSEADKECLYDSESGTYICPK